MHELANGENRECSMSELPSSFPPVARPAFCGSAVSVVRVVCHQSVSSRIPSVVTQLTYRYRFRKRVIFNDLASKVNRPKRHGYLSTQSRISQLQQIDGVSVRGYTKRWNGATVRGPPVQQGARWSGGNRLLEMRQVSISIDALFPR